MSSTNYMPLVTIAIPFYNAELYLGDALHGACSQTYKNTELLLLDDGSSDASLTIARTFAHEMPNLRLLLQSNKGEGYSRGRLVSEARGEYLFFLDADDTIEHDSIEVLLKALMDTDSDIVKCAHFRILTSGDKKLPKRRFGDRALDAKQAYLEYLRHDFIDSYLWGVLYKIDVLRSIEFPVGKKFVDMAVMPDILFNSKRVTFLDRLLYGYRDTLTGIVRTANTVAYHHQIDHLLYVGRYIENPSEKRLHDALIVSHLIGMAKRAGLLPEAKERDLLLCRIAIIFDRIGMFNILLNGNIRLKTKRRFLAWRARAALRKQGNTNHS